MFFMKKHVSSLLHVVQIPSVWGKPAVTTITTAKQMVKHSSYYEVDSKSYFEDNR